MTRSVAAETGATHVTSLEQPSRATLRKLMREINTYLAFWRIAREDA